MLCVAVIAILCPANDQCRASYQLHLGAGLNIIHQCCKTILAHLLNDAFCCSEHHSVSYDWPTQSFFTPLRVHQGPNSELCLTYCTARRPGQYAFLNVPQISFAEWHPFTITSVPSDNFIMFHIKSAGDWTALLHDCISKQLVSFMSHSAEILCCAMSHSRCTSSNCISKQLVSFVSHSATDLQKLKLAG